MRYWIQEFHLDGIRFDAVAQLNNNDFFHWITIGSSFTHDSSRHTNDLGG